METFMAAVLGKGWGSRDVYKRQVRSRIVPYVALYAVFLALHLQFTLGTGDDPMYAAMLDQYALAYFSLWHYYTWSARTLIEAVVCIVEALPAIAVSYTHLCFDAPPHGGRAQGAGKRGVPG